jgi:hypothetical protein
MGQDDPRIEMERDARVRRKDDNKKRIFLEI